MAHLGQPYVWGGESPPTFDCSGLVRWAFGEHGIELPKWARSQWDCGVPVGYAEAQRGDLVFFIDTYDVYAVHGYFYPPRISHVGIALGDGRMINANSERGVSIDRLQGDDYWWRHYHGLRRVLT
jgi:cell wall-associated NlpC family hydrolase